MLTGTVYAALWGPMIFVLSTIILVIIFLRDFKITYSTNLLITYLVISLVFGAVLFIHFFAVPFSNDPVAYIILYLRFIIIGLFFTHLKGRNINFGLLLQGTLKFIACHAILGFILSFFVIRFLINVNSEDLNSYTFLYAFFYNSSFDLFGITFYRNQGLFWEPGILQIFMNILFFMSSFVFQNKRYQIIAAFLILTTYSTTGIGILLLQFLVLLFSVNTTRIQKGIIVLFLVVVALPVFILNYTQKVNEGSSSSSEVTSSIMRVYDFAEGVNITGRYPLTGIGMSGDTYKAVKSSSASLLSNYSSGFVDIIADRRSSNSIMYFLTRFGIPFVFAWFFLLYKQSVATEKRWLFLLIIIISNLSEPLILDPFFVLLVCSGLYSLFRFKLVGSEPYAI